MSGRELIERARTLARASNRDLRVLFMSGYTDEDVIGDPIFESSVAFLQKPFTAEVLARTVRHVLNEAASQAAVAA
jgi:CheY-like chemotaxis protein